MMKPPISRMGGKSKLRKTIIEMIPEHDCYVEVFFGAGWVYFGKESSKVEVINDIESELVNLFRMLKFHPEEIERQLDYEVVSRDSFEFFKNVNPEHLTEIQRAIRFMYLINTSFASRGNHFGYATSKVPNQKFFKLEWIKEVKERLKNTYIENLSFEKILDKYDKEKTLFFCDPPYLETAGYENDFSIENHIVLSEKLKKIKGKFILTINDTEVIRDLYKDFNIKEVNVKYTVSRKIDARKENKELIITNF